MEYLHIVEYSSAMPKRIPKIKAGQYEYKVGESVFHAFIDKYRVRIKEDLDTTMMEDEVKLDENTIPLDDVILVDDVNIDKETQKLAFVFECPVCLSKTISTNSQFDFCPHCENPRFSPEVIGLISVPLMEDIAVNHPETNTLIQIKDDKVVFKDTKKEEAEDGQEEV